MYIPITDWTQESLWNSWLTTSQTWPFQVFHWCSMKSHISHWILWLLCCLNRKKNMIRLYPNVFLGCIPSYNLHIYIYIPIFTYTPYLHDLVVSPHYVYIYIYIYVYTHPHICILITCGDFLKWGVPENHPSRPWLGIETSGFGDPPV